MCDRRAPLAADTVRAASTPGSSTATCWALGGLVPLDYEVPLGASGPDTIDPGVTNATLRIGGTTAVIPGMFSFGGSDVAVNHISNLVWTVEVQGATLGTPTVAGGSPADAAATASASVTGNQVRFDLPGPIVVGGADTTVTLPTVTVPLTAVTAPSGGAVVLAPPVGATYAETPHYFSLLANAGDAPGIDADIACHSDEAAERAKATLTVPVAADASGPAITITKPADGAIYAFGSEQLAAFSCSEPNGGTGVATCTGDVANGAALDTSVAGPQTFTVTATDNAGNTSTRVVAFTVAEEGALLPFYEPLNPARVLDTRDGAPTVDGEQQGVGPSVPGEEIVLPVAGRGGVASDAVAAVLNITATNTEGAGGYVTVYPCGEPRPTASSLNYSAVGQTVANEVISKIGVDGSVCLYTDVAGADLLVDATGSIAPIS